MGIGFLNGILVLPRLISFTGVMDSMPLGQLRSVWGASLAGVSPAAFDEVFDGRHADRPVLRPGYALVDLDNSDGIRSVRWTLIGRDALEHDAPLCKAWERAGEMGLGSRRTPFSVTTVHILDPSGRVVPDGPRDAWPLSDAQWPLLGDPARTPCRLYFPGGLHLRFKPTGQKAQFVEPSWLRIVDAVCCRLEAWLPPEPRKPLSAARTEWLESVADAPMRVHLTTRRTRGWSRRQEIRTGDGRKEFLAYFGHIDLPGGPGAGWPLLLAASWLGFGHHTAEGIGWFRIEPIPS